jgi:hypothetical protein
VPDPSSTHPPLPSLVPASNLQNSKSLGHVHSVSHDDKSGVLPKDSSEKKTKEAEVAGSSSCESLWRAIRRIKAETAVHHRLQSKHGQMLPHPSPHSPCRSPRVRPICDFPSLFLSSSLSPRQHIVLSSPYPRLPTQYAESVPLVK